MPDVRLGASAAVAALVWAGGLAAQVPPGATPRERTLLARVDSLWAQLRAREERERQAVRERARARLVETGGLAVVVPGQVPAEAALRSLDTAVVVLSDFGAIPESFARSVVVVIAGATDTGSVLAAPVVRDRRRVPVGGIQLGAGGGGGPSFNLPVIVVASAIAWAYRDTRDAAWREWLPGNYGIGPWTRSATWTSFESLTRSPWSVGARCLAGEVRGCRLWLGVDRDSVPYTARYRSGELREFFERDRKWIAERSVAGRDCLSGAGAACYAYALEEPHPVPAIPADEAGRRSLIRAVRTLHGPGSLARALADTTGSVGERLARAAGIGEDSLLGEWRYWVLTRGGRPQDRNLLADAAPSVLLAALLLAAARRSRG